MNLSPLFRDSFVCAFCLVEMRKHQVAYKIKFELAFFVTIKVITRPVHKLWWICLVASLYISLRELALSADLGD